MGSLIDRLKKVDDAGDEVPADICNDLQDLLRDGEAAQISAKDLGFWAQLLEIVASVLLSSYQRETATPSYRTRVETTCESLLSFCLRQLENLGQRTEESIEERVWEEISVIFTTFSSTKYVSNCCPLSKHYASLFDPYHHLHYNN